MTESDWQDCADPSQLLRWMAGSLGFRRACLFAVACCERIHEHLTDARSRGALAAVRRFADGRANRKEMEQEARDASRAADSAIRSAILTVVDRRILDNVRPILSSGVHLLPPGLHLLISPGQATAAEAAVRADPAVHAAWAVEAAASCALSHPREGTDSVRGAARHAAVASGDAAVERVLQCSFLRDVLPNPFQPVTIDPKWLAWNDGVVPSMAKAIYHWHQFGDLPVLADALEDAGCTDLVLLDHLRGSGPHTRGCWVLDALREGW